MSEDPEAQNEDHNPSSDPEERRVLFATLDSFRQYRAHTHHHTTHRRRQNLYALPTKTWQTLAAPPISILDTFDSVDDAIDSNATIANAILSSALPSFTPYLSRTVTGKPKSPESQLNSSEGRWEWHNTATPSDMEKARSTIRQFYRDWSLDGSDERQACYSPVISALETAFPDVARKDRNSIRVLVPGAGLGRLVLELCMIGFSTEGNEISYHQLMASNWILNHTLPSKKFNLFPFATDFSNVVSRSHQLKSVQIPDVHPATDLRTAEGGVGEMSMTAGDFLVLYAQPEYEGAFDAVTTVFFVDTAPNVVRYVETIRYCLKEGGVWINLGPLLWHFSDRGPEDTQNHRGNRGTKLREWDEQSSGVGDGAGENPRGTHGNETNAKASQSGQEYKEGEEEKEEDAGEDIGIAEPGSFELSADELLLLVRSMGFAVEECGIQDEGKGYLRNPESMLQSSYRTVFWVVRKMGV